MDFTDKAQILSSMRAATAGEVLRCKSIVGKKTEKTKPINAAVSKIYEELLGQLQHDAKSQNWTSAQVLDCRLRLFYCRVVVNLETRNQVFPYDYMDFARRVGEVWESFCKICWEEPVNHGLVRLKPSVFSEVRDELLASFEKLVSGYEQAERLRLIAAYRQVVDILGNINLKEDEDCEYLGIRYVIDFKSGFGSNEKGNTERLLTVAKIFALLPEKPQCTLVVRAGEGEGNNYLETLRKSGLWKVCCGAEAYEFIQKVTGFALHDWIHNNVDFRRDMDADVYLHLSDSDLIKYLGWLPQI